MKKRIFWAGLLALILATGSLAAPPTMTREVIDGRVHALVVYDGDLTTPLPSILSIPERDPAIDPLPYALFLETSAKVPIILDLAERRQRFQELKRHLEDKVPLPEVTRGDRLRATLAPVLREEGEAALRVFGAAASVGLEPKEIVARYDLAIAALEAMLP